MPQACVPPTTTSAFPGTPLQQVLVIDDVETNATLVANVIGSLCEVHTASSSVEGWRMAVQLHPDLILLDVVMPDMDCFELFRQLRLDPRTAEIPVIFLTALSDPNAEELGLNLGAADFITKPFRVPVLLARVRNHLELLRQKRLLEQMSQIDALTGIANRRHFNEVFVREYQRMYRHDHPLALIMIDVDDFKSYNDHYGHLRGDACLQTVAQVIARCLKRPADLAARYGGKEFVCLLPETDLQDACTIAQHIRNHIRQLQLPHAAAQASPWLSVSMGVTAAAPSALRSSQELLEQADARLYRAKQSGRDCVIADDRSTTACME